MEEGVPPVRLTPMRSKAPPRYRRPHPAAETGIGPTSGGSSRRQNRRHRAQQMARTAAPRRGKDSRFRRLPGTRD